MARRLELWPSRVQEGSLRDESDDLVSLYRSIVFLTKSY